MFFPGMIVPDVFVEAEAGAVEIAPWFTVTIPPLMSVMTALVTAFVVGLGASRLKGDVIRGLLGEFRAIVDMVIRKAIVPLLPVYIFGIFLGMTAAGEVATVL